MYVCVCLSAPELAHAGLFLSGRNDQPRPPSVRSAPFRVQAASCACAPTLGPASLLDLLPALGGSGLLGGGFLALGGAVLVGDVLALGGEALEAVAGAGLGHVAARLAGGAQRHAVALAGGRALLLGVLDLAVLDLATVLEALNDPVEIRLVGLAQLRRHPLRGDRLHTGPRLREQVRRWRKRRRARDQGRRQHVARRQGGKYGGMESWGEAQLPPPAALGARTDRHLAS